MLMEFFIRTCRFISICVVDMILPDFRIFFTHLKDENPDLGLWGKKKFSSYWRPDKVFWFVVRWQLFDFWKKKSIIFRIQNFSDIYILMLTWILNWLQKLTSHWNPSRQDWCPKPLLRIFLLHHVEWYLVFGLYYWPWKTWEGLSEPLWCMKVFEIDIFPKHKTHFLVAWIQ